MELLNGIGFSDELAGHADLRARLAEFSQFLAHAASRPALIGEPLVDFIESRLQAERAAKALGLAKRRDKAGTPLRDKAVAEWARWQADPERFVSWKSFGRWAADAGLTREAKTLQSWIVGAIAKGEPINPEWWEHMRHSVMPATLRGAIEGALRR
ncbi:hypothetical protein [Cupriavidus metallidurans]|uniref:hypothetical protein n=1 Tax=Cupriavidus metallidurans TaxID=119219 RepID=UPI0016472E18|nr:hypothetical protein [Cupriavidus metallidurans]